MAPIKFEENIKEKLENRTLQPSGQAWEKLSGKLEIDAKKTSNKTFWWLGIAASFIGILFIGNVFFSSSETKGNKPVIVDTELKEIDSLQNKNEEKSEGIIVDMGDSQIEIEAISKEKIQPDDIGKASKISKNLQNKNLQVADVVTVHINEEIIDNSILETPFTGLAQTNPEKNTNKTETDIDSLLKKARQNLAVKPIKNSYNIDAQALLEDVEEDIESSFRDKVFETLITGYKKVKTAVVQRND